MNEVRLFHLGGGFGGSDEDSLFILNQVSDYRCEYKIWQMIVD
jgi:hypothetical protein